MDRKSALALLAILSMLCCASCEARRGAKSFDEQTLESLADLPGARETTHALLRAESARITEEGGTPAQLVQNDLPPTENAAIALADLFAQKSLGWIGDRTEALFPVGRFQFNPVAMEGLNRFLEDHRFELDGLDEALLRGNCDFQIDFRRGFFADTSFVDTVSICARFEAFRVAQHLAANEPIEAVSPLRAMFRLIGFLASERSVEARLSAAVLRSEALLVLEAIAQHPATTSSEVIALYQIIQEQIQSWPSDSAAWIGDRALAMHSYEVIRIGKLMMLLTTDEIEIFRAEGMLRNMPSALKRTADQDEHYYLDVMRKIIASCDRPFHTRKALFQQIRSDLRDLRDTSDYPVAAARLFLTDIERGQAIQARDRALTEMWAIALALAAGLDPPDFRINPYSGKEYVVLKEESAASVWTGESGDGHIVVPYPIQAADATDNAPPAASAATSD